MKDISQEDMMRMLKISSDGFETGQITEHLIFKFCTNPQEASVKQGDKLPLSENSLFVSIDNETNEGLKADYDMLHAALNNLAGSLVHRKMKYENIIDFKHFAAITPEGKNCYILAIDCKPTVVMDQAA